MIELRDARQPDIERFYGQTPPYSMRGIVALEDGEPIGIGGLFVFQGRLFMFSEIRPHALKYRRHILRAARRVLQLAAGKIVYACAEQWDSAPRFLQHLGFELIDETQRLYRRTL